MVIKDIPITERPRERLLRYGVQSLSNVELLCIVLKTGTKNYSVVDISNYILCKYQIQNLDDLTITKLLEIKGVGKVKASELLATIELGKRIFFKDKVQTLELFNNPKKIFEASKYLFYKKKQEYFYCLYFNNKQELIERKLLFMGTVNKSVVHPREVFKEAYLLSASSILCMHNHPSNHVFPSNEDIILTKSLIEIGKIQGIPIIDHIIIGEDNYFSFYENKIVDF